MKKWKVTDSNGICRLVEATDAFDAIKKIKDEDSCQFEKRVVIGIKDGITFSKVGNKFYADGNEIDRKRILDETTTMPTDREIQAEIIINKKIAEELDAHNSYMSDSITMKQLGYPDIAALFTDIASEESTHVGELQTGLSTVSNAPTKIQEGQKEATDIVNGKGEEQ